MQLSEIQKYYGTMDKSTLTSAVNALETAMDYLPKIYIEKSGIHAVTSLARSELSAKNRLLKHIKGGI